MLLDTILNAMPQKDPLRPEFYMGGKKLFMRCVRKNLLRHLAAHNTLTQKALKSTKGFRWGISLIENRLLLNGF